MHEAVIGLGSNLGARDATLNAALDGLSHTPGVQLLAHSSRYATPPLGPAQPDFLNAAVRVAWPGTAHGLLDVLLHVEALIGRVRAERWGPRSIDLDFLWWSGPPVRSARLHVPHPGLMQRSFALAPLLDVAPELAPRLSSAMVRCGGTPPRAPSTPADAAACLARTAAACCQAPPPGATLWPLAWDPTPDADGDFTRALRALRRAAGWGFRASHALVLDARAPRWKGRLLGWVDTHAAPAATHTARTHAP